MITFQLCFLGKNTARLITVFVITVKLSGAERTVISLWMMDNLRESIISRPKTNNAVCRLSIRSQLHM